MAVVDDLVYKTAIDEILKEPKLAHYTVEYALEAGETLLRPYRLQYYDANRDFQNGFSDEIMVTLSIAVGDYYTFVDPNHENLFFDITFIPIGESSDKPALENPVQRTRFKAIGSPKNDRNLQGGPSFSDATSMMDVVFQLIPLPVYELRSTMVGGIFHDSRPIDVLRTLLGYYSRQLILPNDVQVLGVEFVPPSNDMVRDNIIIPHGIVYLHDLADYLQRHCGGIYNQGVGVYFHNQRWFIYPLFDSTLYDRSEYTLDVFVIPPTRMPVNDRTFQLKDRRLQILAGSQISHVSPSELLYLSQGNGVRFTQASRFFEEYAEVAGTKVTTDVNARLAEFTFRKRTEDHQHVPFSDRKYTDNIAYEMSKIAQRVGDTVNIKWQHSRPDLLRPGMPVKLIYGTGTGSGFEMRTGQLLAVQSAIQPAAPGATTTRYVASCVLTIYLEPM